MQDVSIDMLERYVEVIGDVAVCCDGIEQLIGHAVGLQVHDAQPGIGEPLSEGPQQPCQGAALSQVLSPAARVLRYQDDLARAAIDGALHIGGDVLIGEAVVAPSYEGDGAIRAE